MPKNAAGVSGGSSGGGVRGKVAAAGASRTNKALDGVAAAGRTRAGDAVGRAVGGKKGTGPRKYVGTAARGAVDGAQKAGLHGAVVGAAKDVGVQVAKDVTNKTARKLGGQDAKKADTPTLGAGGTAPVRKEEDSTLARVGRTTGKAGAAAAVPGTVLGLSTMALFKAMKAMFFQAMAMMMNLATSGLQLALMFGKAVLALAAKPFIALGAMVAKGASALFGATVGAVVAPMTAGTAAAVSLVSISALVGSFFTNLADWDPRRHEQMLVTNERCLVQEDVITGEIAPNVEMNAKIVYSVLKNWGMPNENIAGILGNWDRESGIDPTSVEGIFDEPYSIGPRKQAAWDGQFTHIPGQSHGGIGLGQWSNARTLMLLNYAQAKGRAWYSTQLQLAFMVDGDNPGDITNFKYMFENSLGSPGAAAMYFHDTWERSADGPAGLQARRDAANMWMGRIAGWTVDPNLVGGVEEIIGGGLEGIIPAVGAINEDCDITGAGVLVEGGLDMEAAQALVDLYNVEGEKFLADRFGYQRPGPGWCNGRYTENCVSFTTYFIWKYTNWESEHGNYVGGNGKVVASAYAAATGKTLSNMPTPYSIFSHPHFPVLGHTGIVLAVEGDRILIGEAGWCAFGGRLRWIESSEWTNGWVFLDMSDTVRSA